MSKHWQFLPPSLVVGLFLVCSLSIVAEEEKSYSLSLNYLTASNEDHKTFDIQFSSEWTDRTTFDLGYQNIQVEEDILIPNFAGNEVDAKVFDIGLEHWLAEQTWGLGLTYTHWDDDNQLKNNDLIASIYYQVENWLWGIDVINRDLQFALAVLVPSQGLQTFTRDNDALGFGLNAIYGGWENWLVSFEHQQFEYDEDVVDNPRFTQIQRLPYISNNPLIERSTALGLARLFTNGQLLAFDVSFDTNLLAQSDSTSLALNYSYPMNDQLDLNIGIVHINQDDSTNIFSLGFSWNF